MPSYNPNVPAISLVYNSLAANALPIVVAEHPLDPAQAAPSQVSAQLTFNGTAGSTYYYDTSSFTPGDIMQIGLQPDATSLSTGRYSYTETIIDYRGGTPTTFTYNGTATLENAAQDPTFSALGAGWTISGLEKIISASGGAIVDDGGGAVEWFSGSFGSGGGTYTSPAGDFSTLTANSGGTYTQTFTDGTVLNFNSSGFETTSVDRNGLTTTFTYSGNLLSSITDPFSQTVTFTYNGSNQLQSIKDPANRLTTFTVSGGDLSAVEYPDGSTWDYGYDGSARMTSVTEPSSSGEPTKTTTITYDNAERVGTITRADSTTETFIAAQEQGWTNSGTSGSPAASTLLAEVGIDLHRPAGRRDHASTRLARHGPDRPDRQRAGQRLDLRPRFQRSGHDRHRPHEPDQPVCVRYPRQRHADHLPRPEHDDLRHLQQLRRAVVDDRSALSDHNVHIRFQRQPDGPRRPADLRDHLHLFEYPARNAHGADGTCARRPFELHAL